jgi:hypothetical protein
VAQCYAEAPKWARARSGVDPIIDHPEASNEFTLAGLDRLAEIFEEAGDRPRTAVLGKRRTDAGGLV